MNTTTSETVTGSNVSGTQRQVDTNGNTITGTSIGSDLPPNPQVTTLGKKNC